METHLLQRDGAAASFLVSCLEMHKFHWSCHSASWNVDESSPVAFLPQSRWASDPEWVPLSWQEAELPAPVLASKRILLAVYRDEAPAPAPWWGTAPLAGEERRGNAEPEALEISAEALDNGNHRQAEESGSSEGSGAESGSGDDGDQAPASCSSPAPQPPSTPTRSSPHASSSAGRLLDLCDAPRHPLTGAHPTLAVEIDGLDGLPSALSSDAQLLPGSLFIELKGGDWRFWGPPASEESGDGNGGPSQVGRGRGLGPGRVRVEER